MIKFFRNIRQTLMMENKTGKPAAMPSAGKPVVRYLKYAIGEIVLVVIGILIALQINNWNEDNKEKRKIHTNIMSILDDIKEDSIAINSLINTLSKQEQSAAHIVPIMESKTKIIQDSLKFILDFNMLTTTPLITQRNNTWQLLTSSGQLSEFPDQKLLKLLQDYYYDYNYINTNFSNTSTPTKLQLRELKYELFEDSEHRKFFPTDHPIAPGKAVYDSIFQNHHILALCRYIGSTSTFFEVQFKTLEEQCSVIINYINNKYSYKQQ